MAAEVGKITVNVPVNVDLLLSLNGVKATPSRVKAMLDILTERTNQEVLGYTAEHDDRHTLFHLASEMWARLNAVGTTLGWNAVDTSAAREYLVAITALGLAAIEKIDRKEASRGR